MKVGQKAIVRWISKQAAKRSGAAARKASFAELRELDADQLRHVSGGGGGSGVVVQSPGKTW